MVKTRYDFARELHLTFSSVGGGVHLAILAYKIHQLLLKPQPTVTSDPSLVILLQLSFIVVIWWRMYWVYLNTLVFFKPFDNPWIFFVDVCAFAFGSMVIFFIGKTGYLLLAGGVCLVACWIRSWYTLSNAEERRASFPKSVDRFQQSQPQFLRLLVVPTLYSLLGGSCVLYWGPKWPPLSTVVCAVFLLICIPIFLSSFDPFYPLSEDLAQESDAGDPD